MNKAFTLSRRSLDNLEGVHPDLVMTVKRAIRITTVDFAVIDGLRTVAEQKAAVERGASWTMHSRHLTGHAVDLAAWVDGAIAWEPWELYEAIADAMFKASAEVGTVLVWGGLWKQRDGVHFELHRGRYM